MSRIVLSRLAAADLDDIWDYSAATWDDAQAERYLRQLWKDMQAVAEACIPSRDAGAIRPGYRSFPSGSHVIFFRNRPDGIEIVRGLHRAMDFDRHL